jgi:hypothetical protein
MGEVLECRAHQQHIREHRDPEPDQALAREPPRTLAVERRAAQPPGDQEKEAKPEQPADDNHDRQRVD